MAELRTTNNSNFDVHWSPKIPGVVSASSADGNISIYNLEVPLGHLFSLVIEVCVVDQSE